HHRILDFGRAGAVAPPPARSQNGRGEGVRRPRRHRVRRVAVHADAPLRPDGPVGVVELRDPAGHDRRADAERKPGRAAHPGRWRGPGKAGAASVDARPALQDAVPRVPPLYQRHSADRDRLWRRRAVGDHGRRRRLRRRAGDDLSAADADQCRDGDLAVPDHRGDGGDDGAAGDDQLLGRHRAGPVPDPGRRDRRAARRAGRRAAARRAAQAPPGADGSRRGAQAVHRPGAQAGRSLLHLDGRAMRIAALVIAALVAAAPAGASEDLVSGLSQDTVEITSNYTGTDIVVFGAIERPEEAGANDIIVVVRGPAVDMTVRQKEWVAGIWINHDQAKLVAMPTFYYLSSTRPLDRIAPAFTLERYGLGLDNIAPARIVSHHDPEPFRQALIRRKQAEGVYGEAPAGVE